MNLPTTPSPLFYSSKDRSLYFLPLDDLFYRVNGPSMLIISLDKLLEVVDIEGNKHLSYTFLIPAGMPHTIKSDRAKVAICYLKATGSDLKKLIPLMLNHINIDNECTFYTQVKFEARLRAQAKKIWQETPKACEVMQQLDELISAFDVLHDKNINYQVDPRVEQVIQMVKASVTVNTSVSDMAKEIGISTSRLSQIFRAKTGTSIRNFRLWERVFYTARCLQSGMTLTDAAITAGFADYGQFYRVYNEMGGRLPGKAKIQTIIKAD